MGAGMVEKREVIRKVYCTFHDLVYIYFAMASTQFDVPASALPGPHPADPSLVKELLQLLPLQRRHTAQLMQSLQPSFYSFYKLPPPICPPTFHDAALPRVLPPLPAIRTEARDAGGVTHTVLQRTVDLAETRYD